jgi:16S rRNA (uracil1498-N3)-methyltransferase
VRIFVAPGALIAGELSVTGDEHHYLARVRRARVGDEVELVDGAGARAAAIVTAITDDAAVLQVGAPERIAPRPPFVRALVPPIKGDRMDACLEKLVEVGADEIVIWPAARAVVRWDGPRREARRARYEAALQAAARQSGRAQVPALAFADDLDAAVAGSVAARDPGLRVVLDPASDGELAGLPLGQAAEVTVASGPEGGLSPAELDRLARAGFTSVGLGPRVLRAETAPVIAVALIRAATRS